MFLQSLQPSMGQNTTYFRMLQKLNFFFGNGTKDPFLLWDSQVQNFAISTFTRVKKMGSGHLYFWLIIRPKWHCTQLTSPAKPYFKCIVPSGPLPLTHNGLNSFLKTHSYSINLSVFLQGMNTDINDGMKTLLSKKIISPISWKL